MTRLRRPKPDHPAVLRHRDHRRLWRLVEGGVVDAFRSHPGYLTDHGRASAVQSVTKRVVGQLVGHFKEREERGHAAGRRGPGADTGSPVPAMGAGRHLLPLPRTRFAALHDLLVGGS